MTRILALRIPHLLAQVETALNPALAGLPFVVATGEGPRAQVLGVSPTLAGVARPGAPLASWRKRWPALLVVVGRPERSRARLDSARARLEALLPGVAETRPGLFLAPLAGLARLHPDERELGRTVLARLEGLEGLRAAAGIGSSPLAAHLLARRAAAGELHVAGGQEEQRILDDLPLAGLPGVPVSLLGELAREGVRFVGEARSLVRAELSARHGEAGRQLAALLANLGEGPVSQADPLPEARLRLPEDSADPALLHTRLQLLLEDLLGRAGDSRPLHLRLTVIWNDDQRSQAGRACHPLPRETRRQTLRRQLRQLLDGLLASRRLRVRELRLELESAPAAGQLGLFAGPDPGQRERRLDQALGQLRGKWGPLVVRMGLAPGDLDIKR